MQAEMPENLNGLEKDAAGKSPDVGVPASGSQFTRLSWRAGCEVGTSFTLPHPCYAVKREVEYNHKTPSLFLIWIVRRCILCFQKLHLQFTGLRLSGAVRRNPEP